MARSKRPYEARLIRGGKILKFYSILESMRKELSRQLVDELHKDVDERANHQKMGEYAMLTQIMSLYQGYFGIEQKKGDDVQ